MSKINELTQTIRNFAECELDYGTLKTLKMIDDEAERLETKLQNTSSDSDYAKCRKELVEYIDRTNIWVHDDIEAILKKHFA